MCNKGGLSDQITRQLGLSRLLVDVADLMILWFEENPSLHRTAHAVFFSHVCLFLLFALLLDRPRKCPIFFC